MVSPLRTLQSSNSLRNSIASLAWLSASCMDFSSVTLPSLGRAKARNKSASTRVFDALCAPCPPTRLHPSHGGHGAHRCLEIVSRSRHARLCPPYHLCFTPPLPSRCPGGP